MKSAIKILDSKKEYRAELVKLLSEDEVEKLWHKAASRLNSMLEKYESLPKGVHAHTDDKIFPAAAMYITAKEFMTEEQAFAVIENAAIAICEKGRKSVSKMVRMPFGATMFIKMWDPMTKNNFGSKSGFKNKFYPKEKGAYRMDVLECPYRRYLTELGCPELTRIFCENDECLYGISLDSYLKEKAPSVQWCRQVRFFHKEGRQKIG